MNVGKEPVDAILQDLKQPSALFLGNPVLLSKLTEWFNEGQTSQLILNGLMRKRHLKQPNYDGSEPSRMIDLS